MEQLVKEERYRQFLDMCGQLRFQVRWANLHRVPKTSVMGHSLFVAILSYLFSLEIRACSKRCVNNYFTGLFHDLPEVLTRDIISPVKRSIEGLSDLIKEYEREQMEHEVYSLIPRAWHADIKSFTEDEFDSIITINHKTRKVSSDEINERYNDDRYYPRDGELVKAADSLAAFIEASVAIRNGSTSQGLVEAKLGIRNKFEKTTVAGINFGEIYADFD
jgi:putative hydrolase of HD superfamily